MDLERQRRARGEEAQRTVEAAVGEPGRVQAVGQLAQLLPRLRRLLAGLGDQAGGPGAVPALERPAGEVQALDERDEPLLRAVVDVAPEAPARLVGVLDH